MDRPAVLSSRGGFTGASAPRRSAAINGAAQTASFEILVVVALLITAWCGLS